MIPLPSAGGIAAHDTLEAAPRATIAGVRRRVVVVLFVLCSVVIVVIRLSNSCPSFP